MLEHLDCLLALGPGLLELPLCRLHFGLRILYCGPSCLRDGCCLLLVLLNGGSALLKLKARKNRCLGYLSAFKQGCNS